MASSGLVPEDVRALMGKTIKVHSEAPKRSLYGTGLASGGGRSVKCMIQPASSKSSSSTEEDVVGTWVIYADDVDISIEDTIELPDETLQSIISVETFNDGTDDWYQVVTC